MGIRGLTTFQERQVRNGTERVNIRDEVRFAEKATGKKPLIVSTSLPKLSQSLCLVVLFFPFILGTFTVLPEFRPLDQ
jgi:hypothetical protein